jgi:hypothetical protein
MSIAPRKFFFEQSAFMGTTFWIELLNEEKLYLQKSTSCIPFLLSNQTYSKPTFHEWQEFRDGLEAASFTHLDEVDLCDGTMVEFWCTFYRRMKFTIHLGDTTELIGLHQLLNPLTVCEEFPDGLFYEEGWDCVECFSHPESPKYGFDVL